LLKLYRPLSELHECGFFNSPRSVLDIGCGPATSYLGLTGWVEESGVAAEVAYHGTDVLTESTAYTSAVHSALHKLGNGQIDEFRTSLLDLARPSVLDRRYDLIIIMNVVNEIPAYARPGMTKWLAGLLTDDGAVLFIEPALKDASRGLLGLRDEMVSSGWTVYAPCFRQGPCPALNNRRDWCHAEENWDRPSYIAEIDKHVGLVKLSLKYSYFIMNRTGGTLGMALQTEVPLYRSVSETFKEKGRTRVFLCGEEGRDQYLFNHRDKTPTNKKIQKAKRYDILGVNGVQRRAADIVIGKESEIRPVRTGYAGVS
jgi:hypothetical protein